jgi:hypothetical protein
VGNRPVRQSRLLCRNGCSEHYREAKPNRSADAQNRRYGALPDCGGDGGLTSCSSYGSWRGSRSAADVRCRHRSSLGPVAAPAFQVPAVPGGARWPPRVWGRDVHQLTVQGQRSRATRLSQRLTPTSPAGERQQRDTQAVVRRGSVTAGYEGASVSGASGWANVVRLVSSSASDGGQATACSCGG